MISFKVTYHVHRNFLLFCSAVLVRSGGKGFTTTEQSSYAQHTEATVRGSSSLAQHIACGSSTYSGVCCFSEMYAWYQISDLFGLIVWAHESILSG